MQARERDPAMPRSRPSGGHRRYLPVLAVVTAGLVFLVAVGSSRSSGRISSHGLLDFNSVLGDLTVVLLGLLVVAVCLLAYVLMLSLRRPTAGDDLTNPGPSSVPWWARVLAVFLVLGAFAGVVAAIILRERQNQGNPPVSISMPGPVPLPPGSGPAGGGEFIVHWWILGPLALLTLAALVVVLLVRRRRSMPRPDRSLRERDELSEALQASLDELDEDEDPRRAVIRAYATIERALADHGLRREPSETHVEYLARWAGGARVTRATAEALAALYERARFSLHEVDEQMKAEARSALVSLRRELEEGAS
jgi:hypothetical protein